MVVRWVRRRCCEGEDGEEVDGGEAVGGEESIVGWWACLSVEDGGVGVRELGNWRCGDWGRGGLISGGSRKLFGLGWKLADGWTNQNLGLGTWESRFSLAGREPLFSAPHPSLQKENCTVFRFSQVCRVANSLCYSHDFSDLAKRTPSIWHVRFEFEPL